MRFRHRRQNGFSMIEVLIAMTVFAVLTLCMNSVFIAKASLNRINKEIALSTNAVQSISETIRSKALNNIDYYTGLEGNIQVNLSKPPFNINNLGKQFKDRFVGVLEVKSGEAKLVKDANSDKVFHIDRKPSEIGIEEDKPLTIVNLETKESQTFFVESYNDSAKQFKLVKGKKNKDKDKEARDDEKLKKRFPKGSLVMVRNKEITLEVFHADRKNKDRIDPAKKAPIVTIATKLAAPF